MERILKDARERMEDAVRACENELSVIRTGRASPQLLAHIKCDYYGTLVPINQLSTISIPEARLILIQPFDKEANKAITKAIMNSNLGLVPSTDRDVIRLPIPALTDERRAELTKMVRSRAESARIAIRNVRREVNHTIDKQKKDGELPEDDAFKLKDELQELTDEYIAKIDKILAEKEKEIAE